MGNNFFNRLPDTIQYEHKENNVLSRIKASNCTFYERKNCSRPYGPRSVLSLTECTVFGLYPLRIYQIGQQVNVQLFLGGGGRVVSDSFF